jgi:hypothetical protein
VGTEERKLEDDVRNGDICLAMLGRETLHRAGLRIAQSPPTLAAAEVAARRRFELDGKTRAFRATYAEQTAPWIGDGNVYLTPVKVDQIDRAAKAYQAAYNAYRAAVLAFRDCRVADLEQWRTTVLGIGPQ